MLVAKIKFTGPQPQVLKGSSKNYSFDKTGDVMNVEDGDAIKEAELNPYFEIVGESEPEEKAEEAPEEEHRNIPTFEGLKALKRREQQDLMRGYGLSWKQIRVFNTEPKRIKKILKLQK